MDRNTPDFEHGRVYFKQFGAERVKLIKVLTIQLVCTKDSSDLKTVLKSIAVPE